MSDILNKSKNNFGSNIINDNTGNKVSLFSSLISSIFGEGFTNNTDTNIAKDIINKKNIDKYLSICNDNYSCEFNENDCIEEFNNLDIEKELRPKSSKDLSYDYMKPETTNSYTFNENKKYDKNKL